MARLTGWKRLWVVCSILLLFPALFIGNVLWEYKNNEVIRDLSSPECKAWRELPRGVIPDKIPSINEPCRAIQVFLVFSRSDPTVRSVADYERYLRRQRMKTGVLVLGAWGICVGAIYLAGRLVGWIYHGFRQAA